MRTFAKLLGTALLVLATWCLFCLAATFYEAWSLVR